MLSKSNEINDRLQRLTISVEEKYKKISLLHAKLENLRDEEKSLRELRISSLEVPKLLLDKCSLEYSLEKVKADNQNEIRKNKDLVNEIEELKVLVERGLENYKETYNQSIVSCLNLYKRLLREINDSNMKREIWEMLNEEYESLHEESTKLNDLCITRIQKDRLNNLREILDSLEKEKSLLISKQNLILKKY